VIYAKSGGNMPGDFNQESNNSDKMDRRKFIGAAAASAGILFINPSLVRGTAANSAVRVGLLGCGGRGTEDATNLVETGGARVVALGDYFQTNSPRLERISMRFRRRKAIPHWTPDNCLLAPMLTSKSQRPKKWTPS